ncbi:MAG: cell division protein ZapA [Sphingomonadales bacterium]|nr:cell division protein ZapA [Sphingomonadales bacterium]
MSDVTLAIGGRDYKVACAEGEEGHILKLGKVIDGKLAAMGNASVQGEARSLLFAALLLADEVHELRGKTAAAPAVSPDRLESIALRLENLAVSLEGGHASA